MVSRVFQDLLTVPCSTPACPDDRTVHALFLVYPTTSAMSLPPASHLLLPAAGAKRSRGGSMPPPGEQQGDEPAPKVPRAEGAAGDAGAAAATAGTPLIQLDHAPSDRLPVLSSLLREGSVSAPGGSDPGMQDVIAGAAADAGNKALTASGERTLLLVSSATCKPLQIDGLCKYQHAQGTTRYHLS